MLKRIVLSFFVLYAVSVIISFYLPVKVAIAHGSMQVPLSRILACYLENPETPDTLACRDAINEGGAQAVYDWNEVNIRDAGGNHQDIIPDGMLCSAGREKYSAFDVPRADWAITFLPDSGTYTFIYDAYVPHSGGYFEIYVTNDDYDFSEPLKWSDLEMPPFAIIDDPPLIDGDYYMDVQLPEGKSGRHVIYVIWQRTDSLEAFYSCSDVWFGDSPTPVPTDPPPCEAPQWDNTVVYGENDLVTYNNQNWRSKWSNSGTQPSTDGASNPWEFGGDCSPGGVQPTPVTSTPTPVETPTPIVTQDKGDVNGDGLVDIVDALLVARYYVGLSSSINEDAADVDCNTTVDIVDALVISQFYVGLLEGFSC